MTETIDQPSFWRWLWKGGAKDRTGWQLAFALLLALVTGAVTIPLWTWLYSEFGGDLGIQTAPATGGINIAGPSMIMAIVTASGCRPDDLRSWLLTGLLALLTAMSGQCGLAGALAIALTFMPEHSTSGYLLVIGLIILFLLPMVGMSLATAYFLGWRRIVGREGIAPPPTA